MIMETVALIWTFAPHIKIQLVVLALLLQVAITVWSYTQLSRARVSAYKKGEIEPDTYKAVGDSEPEHLRVYTRLVANQFEMPVLFYALIITGLAIGVTSWITVIFAFLYVFFRYRHASEMTGEHVVFRRRKIFFYSARVLLVLIADLAISTALFVQA